MENTIEMLLFSVIKSVFEPGSFRSDPLSEDELNALYALAKNHDMGHLVGYALEKAGLLSKESATYSKFQKQQMLAVFRQERIDYELSQIRRILEERKIRFLPLKGAVIRSLYPESWMRTNCDIDILVDGESLDAVISLLCEALSYETEGGRNFHDISLRSPSGVHLELHFSILENMESLDGELARVWDYSSPITENHSEYKLTSEYLIFHTVSHMAYHFIHGGCGIRPFLDLYLMRKKLCFDEQVLYNHLNACSLSSFYENAVHLSMVWFDEQEGDALTDAMQDFLLSGGVYGSEKNRISVAQSVKGGKGRYLLGRIFMPYESLSLQYPVLKKHKVLLPACQVHRWFRILFFGRARSSMREIRISSKISKKQRHHMGKLMQRLGLIQQSERGNQKDE